MITLRNGRKISNIVISTILGHSGSGMFPYILYPEYQELLEAIKENGTTVITKSATRYKRIGNYIAWKPQTWKYVQKIRDGSRIGLLNAYGLTNEGVEACAKKIKKATELGFNVIPSFFPEFSKGEEIALKETKEAVEIYGSTLGSSFSVMEYNGSCPNSGADYNNYRQILHCAQMLTETFPELEFIVKFSPIHDYHLVQEILMYGVIAHWGNTFPAKFLYPHQQSPLHKVGGGGYSGPIIFSAAWEGAYNLSRKINNNDRIIFGGGVSSTADAGKYFMLKNNKKNTSVSICSVVKLNTKEAKNIVMNHN